jgi:hypothetical protein
MHGFGPRINTRENVTHFVSLRFLLNKIIKEKEKDDDLVGPVDNLD